MSFHMDLYQVILLVIACIPSLAAYFHTQYAGNQNTKEVVDAKTRLDVMENRVHSLEVSHAEHTGELREIVSNLKSTVIDLKSELSTQREITYDLKNTVARMSGYPGSHLSG